MSSSWRAVNLLFLITSAVQFTANGHLAAFTPLLLLDLGLSEAEVGVWTGLLFGVMMSVAFPLSPFWGVLAERYSRRPLIMRSYFGLALAMVVAAWAPDVRWLLLSRAFMGLSFGTIGLITATQAMLTPRSRLGVAIATVQAAQPIASSLGPPLGALLIPVISLRGLFLLDAVLLLLAALALRLLMPEPAERVKKGSFFGRTREVMGLVWSTPPIRWNFTSAFLQRGAMSVVDAYLPVRVTQLAADPATAIGWILGIYGVVTTAATWLAGRVVDRVEETWLYWRVMVLGALVTVGLALAPWLELVAVLVVLRSIPVAFSNTLLHSHSCRVLPPEQQTPIISMAPMPRNAGGLIFPLIAAGMAVFGPSAALAVGALSYAGTSLAGLRMRHFTRQARAARGGGKVLGEG